MTPPTLLILAAGMGSRYGGLKQIDHFGPNGETLMDYALHDAFAAGFRRVVFIIRHYFETDFRVIVSSRYENRLDVGYVFQEMETLPPGFTAPPERTKPWGTTHAIWCARDVVKEPFVIVNADDYYGKNAFRSVFQFLTRPAAGPTPEYCIVGYPVLQTLSEHGGVTRAICELDAEGYLKALTERSGLERWGETGRYPDETGNMCVLRGDEVVSMNMMGFMPAVFGQLERHLTAFLERQRTTADTSECIIPTTLGALLVEKAARVRVLPTTDQWFGVTHQKDKPGACSTLRAMVERGEYPSPVWNND